MMNHRRVRYHVNAGVGEQSAGIVKTKWFPVAWLDYCNLYALSNDLF
jgi:hypothetical protein